MCSHSKRPPTFPPRNAIESFIYAVFPGKVCEYCGVKLEYNCLSCGKFINVSGRYKVYECIITHLSSHVSSVFMWNYSGIYWEIFKDHVISLKNYPPQLLLIKTVIGTEHFRKFVENLVSGCDPKTTYCDCHSQIMNYITIHGYSCPICGRCFDSLPMADILINHVRLCVGRN